MSSFLVPQVQIDNIEDVLYHLSSVQEIREDEMKNPGIDKLSDDQIEKIRNLLKQEKSIFAPEFMSELSGLNMYSFSQDDDMITIKYKAEYPIMENEVEITANDIDSSFLSGNWFGKVLQFEHKVTRNTIEITLQVEKGEIWPVLILGGSMDLNTAYVLSNYCASKDLDEESGILLYYAAKRYHKMSMYAMASKLMEEEPQKALYWVAESRDVMRNPNLMSMTSILLVALTTPEAGGDEAKLAENILIILAKMGSPDAFYQLGILHLNNPGNFEGSDELCVKYLEHAAFKMNHLNSLQLLGKMYLNGICVEKDTQKGTEYLQKAGEIALNILKQQNGDENSKEIIEKLQNELKENEQEAKKQEAQTKAEEKGKEKGTISMQDTLIAAGVSALVLTGAGLILRRLFRK